MVVVMPPECRLTLAPRPTENQSGVSNVASGTEISPSTAPVIRIGPTVLWGISAYFDNVHSLQQFLTACFLYLGPNFLDLLGGTFPADQGFSILYHYNNIIHITQCHRNV